MGLRLLCVMPPSSSVKVSRIRSAPARWGPSFDGARRHVVKVARQEKRRIRDALVPGHTVHVHDVRLPVALDHVHAIKVESDGKAYVRSEEHTSELQSHSDLVCRLLLEKKKKKKKKEQHKIKNTTQI